MTPALDYLYRKPDLAALLERPCSLFLSKKGSEVPLILSLGSGDKSVHVRHYHPFQASKNGLPAYDEYQVPVDKLFSSELVILQDYHMLPYLDSPLPHGQKQYNDPLAGAGQQLAYERLITNFYCNPDHNLQRRSWLWRRFCDSPVRDNADVWLLWQQAFLSSPRTIATEVVFRPYYPPQPPKYEVYIPPRYATFGFGTGNTITIEFRSGVTTTGNPWRNL